MKSTSLRLATLLVCVFLAPAVRAQDTEPDALEIVPLIDKNAPLLGLWFVAAPRISPRTIQLVEEQVFEAFFKRMEVRLLPRSRSLVRLEKARQSALLRCRGGDLCLIRMGKALRVHIIVGAVLQGGPGNFRLSLKSFQLGHVQLTRLNSMVEGSLSDLLTGGIAAAVDVVISSRDQYAPVDLAALQPKRQPKPGRSPSGKTAPETTAPPRKQVASTPPPAATSNESSAVTAEPPGFFSRHLGSTLALATGIVAGGLGLTFGVLSQEIEKDEGIQYHPDETSKGERYALAANVLFGVAGAATLTSLILFLFAEDDADVPGLSVLPTAGGVQAVIRF